MNGDPRDSKTFRTFEDLGAYQVAREFRKTMYAVARRLPDVEKFALATQIRRAAVSLTNNIAEGHGRHHYKDQLRFLLLARGSLQELLDDLNVCSDENYLPPSDVASFKAAGWHVLKVMNGYGRYLKSRANPSESALHETEAPYGSDYEFDDPF